MTKQFLLVMVFSMLTILSGCQKKEIPQKMQSQAEPQKVVFAPPSDSLVSIEQMKKWLLCNPYLDSLSLIYKDSFAVSDAVRQTKYQEDFLKAQDKICVRVGLTGGYAEYFWILKNIGNPKNRTIVDSLKLTTYK